MQLSDVNIQRIDLKKTVCFRNCNLLYCSYIVKSSVENKDIFNCTPIKIITEGSDSEPVFIETKRLSNEGYKRVAIYPNEVRVNKKIIHGLSVTVYKKESTYMLICHSSVNTAINLFKFNKRFTVEI